MFGYVRVNKPEMKVKEYEVYRGIYCSLCKTMRKSFGILSSLTLSYDLTFFALAELSFAGKIPAFVSGRCPYNPSKKCNYCRNGERELQYAAAVSVMMFYFKVRDNIADGTAFRRLLMYLILPYALLKYKKAKRLYHEAALIIENAMREQSLTEKSGTDSPDAAAHSSADALGKLLGQGFDSESVYRFGYAVGKFVYLCDALDDIEKDIKKKSFNVFVNKYSLTEKLSAEIKEEIKMSLNMCLAIMSEAYEGAGNKSLSPIMENIIYEGTENTMNEILKGKVKK